MEFAYGAFVIVVAAVIVLQELAARADREARKDLTAQVGRLERDKQELRHRITVLNEELRQMPVAYVTPSVLRSVARRKEDATGAPLPQSWDESWGDN